MSFMVLHPEKLMNNLISYQHVMVAHLAHLLICSILQDQQNPLPEFNGDLCHSLSSMVKVLELPHHLFHLNS